MLGFVLGQIGKRVLKKSAPKGPTFAKAAKTPPIPPQALPVEVPMVTDLLVRRSSFEARESDPSGMMQDIVDYANALMGDGHYTRDEINPALIQAYHCDYYLAQVSNGGHSQFVHNAGAARKAVFRDVIAGLGAMGAQDMLLLARSAWKWVQENPEEADKQTGFEGGIAPEMKRLDSPFFMLNKKTPLQGMIAAWIASLPDLRIIEDADWQDEVTKAVLANPDRMRRVETATVRRITAELSDQLRLSAALAAGACKQSEFLESFGTGRYVEIDGQQVMAFKLRTSKGLRFLVGMPESTRMYTGIEHDNSGVNMDLETATWDDISRFRGPEIGELLAEVPDDLLGAARNLLRLLTAGPALDLLLRRHGELQALFPPMISYMGEDSQGHLSMQLTFTDGQGLFTAHISEAGAVLTTLGGDKPLAMVLKADVHAHARAHGVEVVDD
ncbi:DUF4375 domain-containing protein [Tropicibacter naphthalenivorans]|uniref:DNA mimic protein DMP19 C-terminal domain-containing protein n=1 Tax=Tropicibacter naphthalenivorans TaxID=441103 RepID=A0A0P1G027_9RHOB|nr:DUF4375 domain-containing protein [Tropicibacter naphthalenivorans]CUH75022.1 hypothetical protein TRN7648_00212 [Tropicibacter naphthalenivorans]SMC47287.1 protein of unknown function [Tropicibacter naphthalenivorans]